MKFDQLADLVNERIAGLRHVSDAPFEAHLHPLDFRAFALDSGAKIEHRAAASSDELHEVIVVHTAAGQVPIVSHPDATPGVLRFVEARL